MKFEWDESKAESNLEKHEISFEEAKSVFLDDFSLWMFDPDSSEDEDRFVIVGNSSSGRTLLVCSCYRVEETIIRIISARKATSLESEQYWSRK